jgi:hypothetical protein
MTLWEKIMAFLKGEKKGRHCDGPCKHSLHIGINNYPGTAHDLRGCVNDANGWEELLRETFGFTTKKLLDSKATYKNVVREMVKIVEKAGPGSHIVITFSGHGTNVRDVSGDEQDRRDEALCLYDKLLIDDQLRDILGKLPKGANLTFVSDSCHSGTVTRSFLNTLYDEDAPKPRYLPPEDDQEAFDIAPKSVTKKIFTPEKGMGEVLITGCNATQYSYDAKIGGRFQGAMSANALAILKENQDLSYDEFYDLLRKKLPSRNYPQTPQLEGSVTNRRRKVFS